LINSSFILLVYIIPPVINAYGQLFSVAQLIASGYASLVSSGVSLYGNADMLRYFQPQPCAFVLSLFTL
jgi:hypothetical protein